MAPKISIITVVRNAAAELEKTLVNISALDCSEVELELIVIDGASTDQTPRVIERFRDKISYWVSEPDQGLYDAMNKGITAATGDYLWFVNAGDWAYSKDVLMRVFGHSGVGSRLGDLADVYYGETVVCDPSGGVLGLRRKRLPQGGLTWRSLRRGMVVCHQSFIVRREIAPLYDTANYRLAADIDWVIECLKRADGICDTGLILSCFATGGVSTRQRRASWTERWTIMRRHYGLPWTMWAHVGFVVGVILDKGLRRERYRRL